MAFDGIVTKSIVAELKENIVEGKINKIYQPNKNEILFGLYANHKNYMLLINIDSGNCRMHLTTLAKANPLQAPNFCMLLRKHVMGYRIKDIQNDGLERVVWITLEGYNELNDKEEKYLVVELMGKHSNVILLNHNKMIIDSVRHLELEEGSSREILPAHPYQMVKEEKQSFLEESKENFIKLVEEKSEKMAIEKAVSSSYIGINLSFLQYWQKKMPQDLEIKEQISYFYDTIKNITDKIGTKELSVIEITNQNGKNDYIISHKEKENSLAINFAIDDFYAAKEEKELLFSYRTQVLKLVLQVLKKYRARLSNINQKLLECSNRERYRLYGELITSNLYQIKDEKKEVITLPNYYEENKLVEIPLDKKFSVADNAKRYFKKYQKLKNALEIVEKQKKETEQELNYLESVVYSLEDAKTIAEVNAIYMEITETLGLAKENKKERKGKIKKNTKKEEKQQVEEVKIEGYSVWIGKNNKQNDEITTKLARKQDIWFHTKEIHGSHVVLKREKEEEVPFDVIKRVAQIAAYHSKGKLSSNVPVDYCLIKDVKKPAGSKPGMVIYKNNKTIYVQPKEE